MELTEVTVALDWTPNTNHSGFYVAAAKGYYEAAGLRLHALSPHVDAYKATPASRVADGSALLACMPSESVFSAHTWPGEPNPKPKLVAVAALLQRGASAIATLASSGIARPAQLDGKTYASYGARYEGRIVQAMIRADGGAGEFVESTPPMLGIWDTLVKGGADATWIFAGWEGVLARRAGLTLNLFAPEDFGVPYGYSPVLATRPDVLTEQTELLRSFLAATARGYEYAAAHPAEAAAMLVAGAEADAAASGKALPEKYDAEMVAESQAELSKLYVDASTGGRWGVMDLGLWERFLDWLSEAGLLTSKVQSRNAAPSGGGAHTTSLDGLRNGDVGDALPRASLSTKALATNDFLPTAAAV